MDKPTIADLFDLPSLATGYLAAGNEGIWRQVERIDILEHPFPEVEIYLEKNELIFTSFWNSKDSPKSRIQLVKAMIRHGCSGIGIMSGLHLHNKIDDEIIELGNEHNFPVIALNNDTRWSDIIREFYQQLNQNKSETHLPPTFDLLCLIDDFKRDNNLMLLGTRVEKIFKLPILISYDGGSYISSFSNRDRVLSKIKAVFEGKNYVQYAPVSLYVSQSSRIECVFGKSSYFATVFQSGTVAPEVLATLRDIGSFLCQSFDHNSYLGGNALQKAQLPATERFYFFYIRCGNILKFVDSPNNDFIIYDYSKSSNYAIALLRENECQKQSIYQRCAHLLDTIAPQCLIFGDNCFYQNQIGSLAQYVLSQITSIYNLNGIFVLGELPIISLLNIAPLAVKGRINSFNAQYINVQEAPAYLDTLRLFLVLRNINKVSELLGIHVNTVKYRIKKAVNATVFDLDSPVSDIWNINMLVPLESLKLEMPSATL